MQDSPIPAGETFSAPEVSYHSQYGHLTKSNLSSCESRKFAIDRHGSFHYDGVNWNGIGVVCYQKGLTSMITRRQIVFLGNIGSGLKALGRSTRYKVGLIRWRKVRLNQTYNLKLLLKTI